MVCSPSDFRPPVSTLLFSGVSCIDVAIQILAAATEGDEDLYAPMSLPGADCPPEPRDEWLVGGSPQASSSGTILSIGQPQPAATESLDDGAACLRPSLSPSTDDHVCWSSHGRGDGSFEADMTAGRQDYPPSHPSLPEDPAKGAPEVASEQPPSSHSMHLPDSAPLDKQVAVSSSVHAGQPLETAAQLLQGLSQNHQAPMPDASEFPSAADGRNPCSEVTGAATTTDQSPTPGIPSSDPRWVGS